MAIQIKTDGTETEVHPRYGKQFELEEIREYIGGGHIEIVYLKYPGPGGANIMVCDDEGLLKGMEVNLKATMLHSALKYVSDTPIVGDVLLARFPEEID
jgi:hypothetical protein